MNIGLLSVGSPLHGSNIGNSHFFPMQFKGFDAMLDDVLEEPSSGHSGLHMKDFPDDTMKIGNPIQMGSMCWKDTSPCSGKISIDMQADAIDFTIVVHELRKEITDETRFRTQATS
jgi:hypothetical protein